MSAYEHAAKHEICHLLLAIEAVKAGIMLCDNAGYSANTIVRWMVTTANTT